MTDESRGPRGLFRKGQGGDPQTRFKAGDPDNPRTRRKRERDAHGKKLGAKQELKREEMRAELVALDVLERFLSKTRQTTAPRLPRLPQGPNARREADRLAARSLTRSLRSMQRIARDPNEAPEVRVEVARILLERGSARTEGARADAAGKGKAGAKPKVIVVNNNVPRSPWKTGQQPEAPRASTASEPAGIPERDAAPLPVSPDPPRSPWLIAQERSAEERRQCEEAARLSAPASVKRPMQQVAEDEDA